MAIFNTKTILARREKLSNKLDQVLPQGDLVLFFAGEPITRPGGLDRTYEFLPYPEHYWLTGSRASHGVVAYSKDLGFVDFVRPFSREEMFWEGGANEDAVAGKSLPPKNIDQFSSWLSTHKFNGVACIGSSILQKNITSELFYKTSSQLEIHEAINQVRRIKDEAEIQLIRTCAGLASFGYQKLKSLIKAGISERQLQIEYEAEVFRKGAEKMPYDSIVGAGINSAILHATPSNKKLQAGELVLIDAGADIADYCVDITRVFAVDGKFTSQQQNIYDCVKAAQLAAMEKSKAGVDWPQVHRTAALKIAESFVELNLLKGDAEELLESGAVAQFFVHGVGHMVGQRVRDVGGDPTRPPAFIGTTRLRVNIALEAGHVMTVEPGVYFIKSLLQDPLIRNKFSGQINWPEVDQWMNFGGIRIEDDILVTAGSPEVLTLGV